MGLFSKLFGSSTDSATSKEKKVLPWIPLVDMQQLEDIQQKSFSKPQIIFKHSTRCHISRMVSNQLADTYNLSSEDADLYYLDLLAYREVSNMVAEKFQVYHESPQLLVIKNGQTVTHASHGAVNKVRFAEFI